MNDITVYVNDPMLCAIICVELERIGRSVGCHGEECILLIIDADGAKPDDSENIPHTLILGISREAERHTGEFDAILKRPVLLSELRSAVIELLERKEKLTDTEKDEIILLTDKKTVLLNGKKIYLTPNEYKLLELLASKRGGAVSREEINSLLCGDGNTSDVYICMLRKKLTLNRRCPIVTIRGKGYSLI